MLISSGAVVTLPALFLQVDHTKLAWRFAELAIVAYVIFLGGVDAVGGGRIMGAGKSVFDALAGALSITRCGRSRTPVLKLLKLALLKNSLRVRGASNLETCRRFCSRWIRRAQVSRIWQA